LLLPQTYKPNGPHHGVGGTWTFPYQATEAGSSTVRLEYTRVWEGNPTTWFQVTVVVNK
jgi:predicted secreted protein